MKRPGAGNLDRRITLRRVTTVNNEFNEPVETWTDFATVWAQRRDASANESYRAQEVGAEISARFTIRLSSLVADVDPLYRVLFKGREYNITAVRELDRNRFLEIDAVARSETP